MLAKIPKIIMNIDFFDNSVGLYFHIPFCTKKCPYCHFFVIKDNEKDKHLLMKGFENEWKIYRSLLDNLSETGLEVKTVYFGGGTPALLGPERIQNLLNMIRFHHDLSQAEITLEANPENIDLPMMQGYARAGVNRISMGVQSVDTELLQILGRGHSPSLPLKVIQECIQAGISNISIDLMYDLPGQSLRSWEKTLSCVSQWPITHLSLYNLTFEPHTAFYKNKKALQKTLPQEEESTRMYSMAIEILQAHGLIQYEISAFARNGHTAKHNQGYWLGRPFLGFGPSAFSYWNNKRFQNVAHLKRYCESMEKGKLPIIFEEELPLRQRQRELLAVQLRLNRGVDLQDFQRRWGILEPQVFEELSKLSEDNMLKNECGTWSLTDHGRLFYDTVASEII